MFFGDALQGVYHLSDAAHHQRGKVRPAARPVPLPGPLHHLTTAAGEFGMDWVEKLMRFSRKISAAFLIGACLSVLSVVSNREAARNIALAVEDDGAPVTLLGTGASFPAPLYEKWFSEYNRIHPGVQIN